MTAENVKLGDLEVNLKDLANFLVETKQTCFLGSIDSGTIRRSGFRERKYKKDNWDYRDSYTGFFRVSGQEIVRLQGVPVWMMAYNFGMTPEHLNDVDFTKETFHFLGDALSKATLDKPFRGPEPLFRKGKFTYHTKTMPNSKFEETAKKLSIPIQNPLIHCSGDEVIKYKNKIVFSGIYNGGAIIHEKGLYPYFNKTIKELGLRTRAKKCLEAIGLSESSLIFELSEKYEGELFQIKNFGANTLREIRNKLLDYRLQLK